MEVVTVTGKDNQTFVVGVNHGVAGPRGFAAGFGLVDATALPLSPGSEPVVGVESSGPDTQKNIHFTFGIPESGVSQADWNESDPSSDSYINNKPDLSLKEDKSNKVTGILGPDVTNNQYPSAKAVVDTIDNVAQGLLSVIDVKEDSANKVTSISDQSTDVQFPSAKAVYTEVNNLSTTKENKSNKVTSISDQSTDAQYPSAKCVYDSIESAKKDTYELALNRMTNNFHPYLIVYKNGRACSNTQFWLTIAVGKNFVGQGENITVTTSEGGGIGHSDLTASQIYNDFWLGDWSLCNSLSIWLKDSHSNVLSSIALTRPSIQKSSSSIGSGNTLPTSDAVKSYAEDKSNKVTSISPSSTNTQYPSAKAVYDLVESKHPDVYEIKDVQMDIHYIISFSITKNGEWCGNTQFTLLLDTGTYYSSTSTINVTTDNGGNITLSDTTVQPILKWLGNSQNNYSNTYFKIIVKEYGTNYDLCSYTVTRNPVTNSVLNNSWKSVTSGAVYTALQNLPVYTQVQSDWNQTTVTEPSYIRNKPTGVSAFTNDAGYVTSSQVPAAQVNSDWNSNSGKSQILNKPDLSLKEDKSNKVTSISSVSTDTQYPSAKCVYDAIETVDATINYRLTNVEDNKEDSWKKVTSIGPSSTDAQYPSAKCVYDAIQAIPSQVQSDWDQTDNTAPDYIKNKPSSTLQEQADWTETNTLDPSYIRNKPDLTLKEDKSNKVTSISSSSTNTQYPTAAAVYNAIQNIPAIVGTQSDWTQTDITDPSYIKHKPDLSLKVDTSSIDIGFPGSPSDSHVPSTKLVYDSLADKVSSAVVGSVGSAKVSAFISAVQDNDTTVPTGHGVKSYVDLAMETAFDNLDYTDSVSGDYVTSVSERDGVISLIKGTKGTITQGSTGLVDGGTVYTRTQNILEGSYAYTDNEIQRLDYTDNVQGDYVTSVSETNGVISVTKGTKGTISSGDPGLVDGGTVFTAVDDVIEGSRTYTNDSIGALDYTDNVQGDYVTSVSESNGIVSLTKGSKGTITSGNTGLVDGGTVYTALQNIPVTTQVQSDWSETDTTDPSYIQNKPTLATVATSGDYDDLIDKPDLTLKEDVSNKVTLIDSASTDTEYPSAKAVYDTMTNWQTGTKYIENTTVYTVYSSPIALRASALQKGVTYIYHFYISDNGMSGTKTYFEAKDSALYRIESSSYTRVISTRTGSRLNYSATDVRSYGTSPEYWTMFVTRVTDPVS